MELAKARMSDQEGEMKTVAGYLKVKVNGREWKRVESFDRSTAKDSHFVLDPTSGRIRFGDGVTGKRPAAGARSDVSYRAGDGGIAFRCDKLSGVYRGVVLSNVDPHARLRLLVDVPQIGVDSLWAAACLPLGANSVPQIGDTVWVSFESGNADYPVWLGVAVR